ncbi:MAG: ribonuclease III [Chloroflexi bacterium]|nr:ribonuclease III [Chloroflexota bacterium]
MEQSLLEQAMGYAFKDKEALRLALTHPSYINEHPEESGGSNQRLEFLGDACIGLIIGREVYRRYPELDEGALTEARSHVVRGEALAKAARRLDLGRHLVMGQGERARGGDDRESNLADAFEALVGAVLLDGGYRAAQRFALSALRTELEGLVVGGPPKDPKSQLQEMAHLKGIGPPVYEVVRTEGPPHQPVYTIVVHLGGETAGTGEGKRKVEAERRAAQAALEGLRGG